MPRYCLNLLCIVSILISACAPSASPTPIPITPLPPIATATLVLPPTRTEQPTPAATNTPLARIINERPTPVPAPNCLDAPLAASNRKDFVTSIATAAERVFVLVYSPASTRSTLFVSDDDGASWTNIAEFNDFLSEIAASPEFTKDRTVFAAGAGAVYRSLSAGANWSVVTPGTWVTSTTIVRQFAISPNYANDRTVLLGSRASPRGVFASTDAGNTWIDWLVDAVDSVMFSPNYAQDRAVWVARNDEQTFRRDVLVTVSEGAGWELVRAGTAQPVAISPAFAQDSTIIWSDPNSGLFVSRNGDKVFPALEKADALALNRFRSTQTGGWVPAGEQPISDVSFSPAFEQDETAYAITDATLIVSRNRGVSWTPVCYWDFDAQQLDSLRLNRLSVTQNKTLMAGGTGARVLVSRDGGRSWQMTPFK